MTRVVLVISTVACLLLASAAASLGQEFVIEDLGGMYRALAMNNLGQVVGANHGGTAHPFLWTPGGAVQDLGALGGNQSPNTSAALAVNDMGQVAGHSRTDDFYSHAFLWTSEGGMQDLGTLPGHTYSRATDINDLGQVVGPSYHWDLEQYVLLEERASLWTPESGMQDLGTLGGSNSRAAAVNESSQVAGSSDTAGWAAACLPLDARQRHAGPGHPRRNPAEKCFLSTRRWLTVGLSCRSSGR